MVRKVIVIGASGHSAEIQDYISELNKADDREEIQISGYIDDNPDVWNKYAFKAPYLGAISDHDIRSDHQYVMGIANTKYRRVIIDGFLDRGAIFKGITHPGAYLSESALIGAGCIIGPNVNVGPNVRIGDYNLLNARCSLGHDTQMGNYNFISPNVSFSGGTIIGNENLFGVNSATKPGLRIGDRNKIEAGMVLDKNIGDDGVVFFRYKEKIIAYPKL